MCTIISRCWVTWRRETLPRRSPLSSTRPPIQIQWGDVDYLWAEQLMEGAHTGHHGDYDRVYVESLRRRWDPPESTTAKD
jgi:hypothetical protein